MADQTTLPSTLPGDIVQISGPQYQGALVIVEEVRHWGVTGYAPHLADRGPTKDIPLRLRHDEFVPAGVAAVMSPGLASARQAAIETARTLAREAAERRAAEPPAEDDPDDMTMKWDVEVRFNGRTTGQGQVHRERVRADCVEQALDVVRPPVMEHGGSICIVGVTVDEVKA